MTDSAELQRLRIQVVGIVQGVGFRPFVWQRATRIGVSGWVKNDTTGVTIEIQGSSEQLQEFVNDFAASVPALAQVDSVSQSRLPSQEGEQFVIIESDDVASRSTPVSPDTSVCDDCLLELQDPTNRRFRYPFINCTNCGPRFTIVKELPYDRPNTTMQSFPMCAECMREYDDPANRRFHAQPNACHDCGPQIWHVRSGDAGDAFQSVSADQQGDHALDAFRQDIADGNIVAIKGIGGFHLACDATNDVAITKLRNRKGRIDKPFAVLVRDLMQAEQWCVLDANSRQLLKSKERPIVLLPKRENQQAVPQGNRKISELVAPGNDFLGLMLPYSPLHCLISEQGPPLLLTSGNLSDEPIVIDNLEARSRLCNLADSFLLHDRDIHVVCDDSVVRKSVSGFTSIRRSRGYAPKPILIHRTGEDVLAVGGEIKSTFCVTKREYAYLSQHLGDMENLQTLEAMQRNVEHFSQLFRVQPRVIVADLHPGYLSTQWAKTHAEKAKVPLIQIQHHFAHLVSLLVEHHFKPEQRIIGCCFDGTGFGTDGAIWGGEFMIANMTDYERIGHLKYLPLPGGDSAVRRPAHTALAHLHAANAQWNTNLSCVADFSKQELKLLEQQISKRLNCVDTSSAGRLFDAVASIIGIRHRVTYEAQAAMEMEALASRAMTAVGNHEYHFELSDSRPIQIDSTRVIEQTLDDVLQGRDTGVIAARFHIAVANMIVEMSQRARNQFGLNTVGLSGGVFQNSLLLQLTIERLREAEFEVLIHLQVPPNDGGLALGQAAAARQIRARENG